MWTQSKGVPGRRTRPSADIDEDVPFFPLPRDLTPGNAGLYQINLKVPQGAPIGDAVPLTIAISNGRSDSASVAIRS